MSQFERSTKDNVVQLVRDPKGRYGVIVAGEVVFNSRVLSAAEIYYAEEVEKHKAQSRQRLVKERAHFDMEALRSESRARRRASALRKGGKGGHGGV